MGGQQVDLKRHNRPQSSVRCGVGVDFINRLAPFDLFEIMMPSWVLVVGRDARVAVLHRLVLGLAYGTVKPLISWLVNFVPKLTAAEKNTGRDGGDAQDVTGLRLRLTVK